MKKGVYKSEKGLYKLKGPIKILGISSSKRKSYECAREDPINLFYLKLLLKECEKYGAKTELLDLHDLKIGVCKECYSSNPAQCRYHEKKFQCDCYPYKEENLLINNDFIPMEKAYDLVPKKKFFEIYRKNSFGIMDDMHVVYKALMNSDGVVFSTFTCYYGRPALLQTMFSRLCALDGGVEELWGDGKNLNNSVKYSKNPNFMFKQRLYGKYCAFINVSKEGDSVTPNLMKACVMMGMKMLPLGVAYHVNWYNDKTHRSDFEKSKNDKYTLSLINYIAEELVKEIKNSKRIYGICSKVV